MISLLMAALFSVCAPGECAQGQSTQFIPEYSVHFGEDDSLRHGADAAWSIADSFVIAFWIKFPGTPGDNLQYYFDLRASGDDNNRISVAKEMGEDGLSFAIWDSAGVLKVNADHPTNVDASLVGRWNRIIIAKSSGNWTRMWVNGVVLSATGTYTNTDDDRDLYLNDSVEVPDTGVGEDILMGHVMMWSNWIPGQIVDERMQTLGFAWDPTEASGSYTSQAGLQQWFAPGTEGSLGTNYVTTLDLYPDTSALDVSDIQNDHPPSPPVLEFDIIPSRCTTTAEECPAPLAVMFRTSLTNEQFMDWHCEWDFGDDDSVSGGTAEWAQSTHPTGSTLALKNKAVGPIAGHVYDGFSASAYLVTARCTDSNGDVGQDIAEIYVDDPDVIWSASETICVSGSGDPNDFLACPFTTGEGATHTSSSDFDAPINAAVGGTNRVLFHRGESFVQDSSVVWDGESGPGMIGAYGSGALPVITFPSQGAGYTSSAFQFNNTSDWRLVDFDFNSANGVDAVGICTGHGFCPPFVTRVPNHHLLFYRLDLAGNNRVIDSENDSESDTDYDQFWVDLTITGASDAHQVTYVSANGGGFLGVDVNGSGGVRHFRTDCTIDFLFQHNDLSGGSQNGDDFRACSGYDPTAGRRVLISDNEFHDAISIKPNGRPAGAFGHQVRYGLFERNTMLGKQVSIKFLNDWTFRNNNFFHNGSGGVCLELSRGFCNTGDFNNIRFEGNSCRRNSAADGGIAFSFVGGGGGTDTECGGTVPNVTCGSAGGCTCKNNLYYDNTNSVDACTDNSGGTPVVMSGNLHAVDDPFTDASPTERDSFVLDDSGQTEAAGATRIYPSDAAGRCRTIGAGNTDIGALEFGAPEAPCP